MADCSALLDEDFSSFVFNYLTEEQVPGEEPLHLDFPEIDLSQLDAGDFDSSNCFSELQWYSDHSENESSQYSTNDSELFQIIDSENEALLAALTRTLDDIQEEDVSLSAFQITGDGDLSTPPVPSPKPSVPAAPLLAPESDDELSLLKKLLLSPAHAAQSSEAHKDASACRQGGSKSRSQRGCTKVENPRDRKPGFSPGHSRSCSELHKHLISAKHSPQAEASAPAGESPNSSHQGGSHKQEASDSEEEAASPSLPSDSACSSSAQARVATSPQFACNQEMQTVIALIQYMHTYCLPQRKLLIQDSDMEHQHCTNLSKRAKLRSSTDRKTTASTAGASSCTKLSACLEVSILRELLAKDIPCDVSKPYRLVQPAYTSLSCAHDKKAVCRLTQEAEAPGLSKLRVKTQSETVPAKQSLRPSLGAEGRSSDMGQGTSEGKPGKLSQKQERGLYAVRRSKRLNPELSKWLSSSDEKSMEEFDSEDEERRMKVATLSLGAAVLLDEEEQVAGVEVGGTHGVAYKTESHHPLLESGGDRREECLCSQLHHPDKPRCLSLSLSQNDASLEKKSFEQALTVELCGTAGLTPPTTPPYKPAEEELYKPDTNHQPEKDEALVNLSAEGERTDEAPAAPRKPLRKHPERTELLAHLRQGSPQPARLEQQGLKRPFSRSFGDHDYCLATKPEAALHRKVLKPCEPLKQVASRQQQGPGRYDQDKERKTAPKASSKPLKDHEIRASLSKHFGFLENSLEDEDAAFCKSPDRATVFASSGSESGSPVKEECSVLPCKPKLYPHRSPPARASLQPCSQNWSTSESSCCRSRSPANRRVFRCENSEQCREQHGGGDQSRGHLQKRREKAIDEGRMVCIRNLSRSMSPSELKQRFEVFGEIVECRVLSRGNREDKYGFITYRCSEDAALSLRKGTSLRQRNEPSFQLSYGGHRHFFWTRYTDLDSNAGELSTPSPKSKYECMDFDSLLKEAQRSLHR